MAFVFGKTKRHSAFQVQHDGPSPGQYHIEDRQIIQHSAPFNSSVHRTSAFEVEPTKAGPGYYNSVCPSQLLSDKKIKMASSFTSKVQRFKTQPSPKKDQSTIKMRVSLIDQNYPSRQIRSAPKQSYQQLMHKTKTKMGFIQQTNNKRKIQSIGVNRQFVRIVLSNPKNTEVMHSVFLDHSIVKKEHGPGSYDIENASQLCHHSTHVVDWSKTNAKRFKHQKNKNPGPGAYTTDDLPKRSQSMSSAFAFRGLRSFMDEVMYKTKMPFKVKVIEQKKLKDRYPGPGQYETKLATSKSFHHGIDCFGTTTHEEESESQRKIVQKIPGPGSYNPDKKSAHTKQRLKEARQKIFGKQKQKSTKPQTLEECNKDQVRKQCIRQMENVANKFYTLKERCCSKVGNLPQGERFKNNKDSRATVPGPGQYKEPKESEQSIQKGIQYGFNSTSTRIKFIDPNTNLPFYDVDRQDMGKKALRIKKSIQNLKQIQIEKAPFNCCSKRFSDSPAKNQPQDKRQSKVNANMNWSNQQAALKNFHQRLKSQTFINQNLQQSSAFRSRSKRSWAAPSNPIGPGAYLNSTSLQKKSFNQQYNYQPPVKIRSTYRTKSSLA